MKPFNEESRYAERRAAMVRDQIAARGIGDPRVLAAMREVPRHLFVPESLREEAYEDHPLPIGLQQTISQPYIVAYMAEALGLFGSEKILEIGSGSGYMMAVLAGLCKEAHGVELMPFLVERSRKVLSLLGIANVRIHSGDGEGGWPECAPYDRILVSCACLEIPKALLDELAPGGALILPLQASMWGQELVRVTRSGKRWLSEKLLDVAFVPLRH